MNTYPTVPVAVELSSTDLAAAIPFYEALLGWSFEQAGDAVRATVDGLTVATLRPSTTGRSGWSVVFAAADLAATRAAIVAAGGSVDGPDTAGLLRATDHAGATFAITGKATRVPSGPGRASWFEYLTTDPGPADEFYPAALGLATVRPDGAPDDTFLLLAGSGPPVAGRLTLPPELAAAVPPGWMVYLGCADVDATVAVAADLGGFVAVPPRDAPTGRLSAVVDPAGAAFTLLRPVY